MVQRSTEPSDASPCSGQGLHLTAGEVCVLQMGVRLGTCGLAGTRRTVSGHLAPARGERAGARLADAEAYAAPACFSGGLVCAAHPTTRAPRALPGRRGGVGCTHREGSATICA